MRKTLLIAVFAAAALSPAARADTLAMRGTASMQTTTHTPVRGQSMGQVTREFGQPKDKHPTVGGGKPKQPPITRWDYDSFSVVFERTKVVDVVFPGAPMPVQKTDELKPAS